MSPRPPALVAVSHGTSSPEGRAAVRALFDAVVAASRERWGADAPEARLCHVDVEQPDVPSALATLPDGASAVLVPLLLSAGYHVHVDLAEAAAESRADGRPVAVADALGPDDRLVPVLRRRLAAAGARGDDAVVLAAAGSSDARAVDACRVMSARLAQASPAPAPEPPRPVRRLRFRVRKRRKSTGLEPHPVSIGFLSAAEPRLDDAVRAARDAARPGGRVAVASYLLAPGYFQDLAAAGGPDVMAAPLLRHDEPAPPELVAIVLDRYAAGAAALA
ncbi:sirohydrochlorin chelatase [Agromyces sp. SYSU T00194]|uniref:sirohydrochlorin chelatase n=1 Tax=Agromyces chitinivorans TaxID=3158560 RepID=UPI003395AA31